MWEVIVGCFRGSWRVVLCVILEKVLTIAEAIDAEEGGSSYVDAVRLMQSLNSNPDETPSARVLEKLRSDNCSFFDFTMSNSIRHRDYFAAIAALSDKRCAQFENEAQESVLRQQEIERGDSISLDEYLAKYYG